MKQLMRGFLAVTVCCVLIFTTACGDAGQGQGASAMGRYVETEMTAPEANVTSMHLLPNGVIRAHTYNWETEELMMYETEDFLTWNSLDEIRTGEGELAYTVYDSEGTIHYIDIIYESDGEDYTVTPRLYRQKTDGSREEVVVNWYQSPDNSYYVSPDGLWVLDNGDYIMTQWFDRSVVQYTSEGELRHAYSGGFDTPVTTNGNTIYIMDTETALMRIYDGETQQSIGEVLFENSTQNTSLFSGQEGAVYMQNNTGLYRFIEDGSVWEKLIDGELTSMSMPTLYFNNFVETEDGSFYCIASDGYTDYRAFAYRYDPDVPTLPESELVVYMLEENDTVRQAAGIFQKQNPNTRINIQVARGDGSATKSDLIRALNTELLSGKGPDVLILDEMNVESYIKKGALADITDMVRDASDGREMIDAVLNTYEQDGRLYAIPAKFKMPIMAVQESDAAFMATLEGFSEFALEHPENSVMGDLRPENLIATFLPASASAWIQDGAIDAQALAEFLELMKTVADSGQSHHTDETELQDSGSEAFHYAFGRAHTMAMYARGIGDMTTISLVMDAKPDTTIIHLPGQQEKIFVPSAIASVNVNSDHKEVAAEFIKALLSDEVQTGGSHGGFPVSISALDKIVLNTMGDNVMYGFSSSAFEGEELVGYGPSVERQQMLADLAKAVQNPATADQTLTTLITDTALGYFTGSKDLSQTIKDVEEATRLYLAE